MNHILLLEDIPEIRAWLKALVKQVFANAQITECSRVQDALSLVNGQRFTLALLDLGLPGEDGFAIARQLREHWRPINPWSYLEQVRRVQALLVYASYDLTFPVDLSRILIDEFGRLGLPHEVRVLPCGHYSTGIAPFKFLDAYLLTSYLRRAL